MGGQPHHLHNNILPENSTRQKRIEKTMEQINLMKIQKKNGAIELRTNFGRKITAVMTKGGEYFNMNIYENRPRYKENKMCLGFDELNELLSDKGGNGDYERRIQEVDVSEIVPAFPEWFNIVYDEGSSVNIYHHLDDDLSRADLVILI
ncbi:Hypothetical predicted protein [Mytilus galloprovincialis]|uniref:Uncharacterized protein n=1 Tax=Mytilus galloprovincialis TaxID=29158 RepID=A0A8B6BMG2_MYTGA|nr:Hypothetical predicted protein [Mytilus galloprovincialis]